jgi:arylsulfatase
MKNRAILRALKPGLLLGLSTLLVASRPTSSAPVKPNIILILADDLGYADLGCLGSEIPTPNLDRLARAGLLMTNFYNAGRCCPSRASLLTGRYPHETGIGDMDEDRGLPGYRGHLSANTPTLAEVLKPAGYVTGLSGKWHVGRADADQPRRRGFDEQFLIRGGGGMYFYPPVINRTVWLEDRQIQPDSSTFYSTDAISDYAVEFVEKHRNEPYFLHVAHVAPHFPLQAKPRDIAKFRRKYRAGFEAIRKRRFAKMKTLGLLEPNATLSEADPSVPRWETLTAAQRDTFDLQMATYAAQISCLDEGIGRLIRKLEETGQLDRTVIFFLSDNGGEASVPHPVPGSTTVPGHRRNWSAYGPGWANGSNVPFRRFKKFVHEGGTRTPLIVHYPAVLRRGRVDRQPGHIIDLMPTCLELAGAGHVGSVPLEGRSVVPVFKNEKLDRVPEWGWEHEGNRAYRRGTWKLVSEYPANRWELYDLTTDPTETRDLGQERPEKVAELRAAYEVWAKRIGVLDWSTVRKIKGT